MAWKKSGHLRLGSGGTCYLCRRGAVNSELGTLREVSELGFAYTHRASEVTEPTFVPWSAVSWVRPFVPEDLANSETEAEQANPVSQIRPPVPEDRES